MNTILTEKEYQHFIIDRLLEQGYALRANDNYDRSRAMDPDLLFQFLEGTQTKKMAQLKNVFKENLINDTAHDHLDAEG